MADTWGQMLVVPPHQRFAGVTGHAPLAPSYAQEPDQTAPPFFQAPPGIDPNTGTTIGAAFGLNNEVVGGIDLLTRPAFKPDPTYDVAADPEVTGADSKYGQYHLDRFVGVQSKDEARAVMSRIDREEEMQNTLARSGWAGMLATLAAGALSPTTAIPLGGWMVDAARFGRAGVIGIRALEGAAVAGGGVAAQEAILQRAQETRSAATSFWNIGGASILGSILGGTVSHLALSRAVRSVGEDLAAPSVPRPTGAGAAAVEDVRGTGELAGSAGVANALGGLTPGLRTETSPLVATRNTVRDLMSGEQLAENEQGIASSVGGSVEAQVKALANGPVGASAEEMRALYSDYFFGKQVPLSPLAASIAEATGRGNGRLTYQEFSRAVSDALLDADRHSIPEVQKAAQYLRKTVFDPLKEEAMNTIKGFREMVDAGGSADIGYLTRIWNRISVRANRDELRGILVNHFLAVQGERFAKGFAEDIMPRQELEDAAQEVIDNILGQSPARMTFPNEFNIGKAGPLKERALRTLPTKSVLKFVERDAEKIAQFYARSLAPDIALTKKFGSIELTDQLQKIRDEANAKGKGQTAQVRKRLDRQAEKDIADITLMRDRLLRKRLPDDPNGLVHRSIAVVKAAQFLASLGTMTLSSASDLGKPVFIHGLTRTMQTAFYPLVHGLKNYRLAAKEVKLAGTALDMIANDRALAFTDLIDEYGVHTPFERGVQQATRAFSFATLMAPWNATLKQFAGIVTQTRALQGIEALATGKALSTKEIAYLASGGIDRNMADKIGGQFAKHGNKDGAVWSANTSAWTDKQAVLAFRSLINRDVDRIIVTPGIGDKANWMTAEGPLREFGPLVGQFQSFAIASIQKTLVAGLQQRDMAVLNGLLIMLAFGAMSYWSKTTIAGGKVSNDPRVWAAEAVDNSGVLGILMNGDHIVEKWTGDHVGISALTGQPPRRYINVNAVGSLLGPTAGKLFDLADLSRAITNGQVSASDAGKIRRLLPLQNLFYMRWLFDKAEEGAVHAFGIPARKPN